MNKIYPIEQKKFEARYGPAIAQFLCDELEYTERLNSKDKTHKLTKGFDKNTIFFKAA